MLMRVETHIKVSGDKQAFLKAVCRGAHHLRMMFQAHHQMPRLRLTITMAIATLLYFSEILLQPHTVSCACSIGVSLD